MNDRRTGRRRTEIAVAGNLADLIAHEMARWQMPVIEEALFGSAEPETIAAAVEGFCMERLGATVEEGLFYRGSVGCTFGLALSDSRRLVLKVHQPRSTWAFLQAVQRVQLHLAERRLPVPRPIGPPLRLREDRPIPVTTESLLLDPGLRPFQLREMEISASALSRVIAEARSVGANGLEEPPLRRRPGSRYPDPHSPIFDFRTTGEGAEWIDRWADRALEIASDEEPGLVVAHADWSARNLRIAGGQLVAAYDWDSLALVSEAVAVGQAAITWRSTAEPGDGAFPDTEEVGSYFRAYEEATGHLLDWQAAGAASLYLLCYIARCEHSLVRRGMDRPDQHGATSRLADEAQGLLALTRLRRR